MLDPIFNMGSAATRTLERFAANAFTGRLSIQCRAELADEEFVNAAAQLHTRLELGLQTNSRS